MATNSVLSANGYEQIKTRIENLQPNAERLWGKMDVAQMLTHCSVGMEQAIGKAPFKDESNFLSRTLIKWVVLRNIKNGSFGKNLPTVKSFYVTDEHQFAVAKKRLLENLTELHIKGQTSPLMPHPGFGSWSNKQWGELVYVHFDHHLKQFSA